VWYRYLVRQTLTQGLYGVTRHYWYDMVDDRWQKFGLVKYAISLRSLTQHGLLDGRDVGCKVATG
jgi:hypothetical protein